MKNDSKLEDRHYLILRSLKDAGGEISYDALRKICLLTLTEEHDTSDFRYFVRVLSDKPYFDKAFAANEETITTQLVEDLEVIGNIELVETKNDPNVTQYFVSDKILTINPFYGKIIVLTEEGERIQKVHGENRRFIIRPQDELRTTIFIACAFGYEEIDNLSEKYFYPACKNLGYETVRVDLLEPHQTITEIIMDGITESACVIADLTYARPSVYFEIGYAVGLGIPLILTCREDYQNGKADKQRVHFDLAQYKISFWKQLGNGKFEWTSDKMIPEYRLKSILKSLK